MAQDPKIVLSPLSGKVTKDGITVDVQIYRLENGKEWCLEVVDEEGTSTVWEDLFPTDQLAHTEFRRVLDEEGIMAILRDPSETIH